MNAFRRFLLRDGAVSRMFFLAAFAVLFARALLPGAVMLVPVSVAQGGFALVMCSGHGPMFAHSHDAMEDMSASMPGMDMSHMAGMMHHAMGMSGGTSSDAHDSMASDDGLCPFSAALAVACVGFVLACVLFELIRVAQSWDTVWTRTAVRAPVRYRPPSRAPPCFS
ncbi:hypothetical protein [Burkholderia multivorans]|uniref:DUF2946 domain-containing protein n=1 Tax=Burkholderia multivorans TaxID=87883 RepID=A0AB37ASC1_9BURK|nr:hypothetical protein [Burkholderia multivorans]PRE45403.1 hypothetical protein C6P99_19015 [Burkholderia multivorans]PRE52089.1 hypothetical protein C6P97_07230 [Burkholderia multivorans]